MYKPSKYERNETISLKQVFASLGSHVFVYIEFSDLTITDIINKQILEPCHITKNSV